VAPWQNDRGDAETQIAFGRRLCKISNLKPTEINSMPSGNGARKISDVTI